MSAPGLRPAGVAKVLQRIAVLGTALVVLYVALQHFAGMSRNLDPVIGSESLDLRGPLPSGAIGEATGAVSGHTSPDGLRVSGARAGAGDGFRLTTRQRRLTPSVIVRAKVRARSAAPVDIAVGLVADGERARHLEAVWHVGAGDPMFGVNGDRAVFGPEEPVRRVFRGQEARVASIDAAAWHEVSARFELDAHVVIPSFDGQPLPPVAMSWAAGQPVRPSLEVRAREGGADVEVDVRELEYQVLSRTAPSPVFEDAFAGKVLDPVRWTLLTTPTGEVHARPAPGLGLWLRGDAPHDSAFVPAVSLQGLSFLLTGFDLRMKLEVRQLAKSAFVVGFAAHWHLPWFFEVAIAERSGGGLELLVSGHFGGDGQFRLEPLGAPFPRGGELGLVYDGARGVVRVEVDGKPVGERRPDLLRGEEVRLRFGANFQQPDAAFDVLVKSLVVR